MKKQAAREAFGQILAELAAENPEIIVLDADLGSATKTGLCRKACPDQFVQAGIAECNMVGMAAGIAAAGLRPFASSFAMFLAGRAFEQIRNSIAYTGLNVKLCGTHAGITVGEDGGSHQCLEDIALMRSLPGMEVYQPADGEETRALMRWLARSDHPAYVRLSRAAVENIYPAGFSFVPGAIDCLRPGQSAAVIASGVLVSESLKAAALLEPEGIDVAVYNLSTIKPLNHERLCEITSSFPVVFTAEEHWKAGGIWSAVREAVENPSHIQAIAVEDRFGQSGSAARLMDEYGLSAACIADRIRQACSRLCPRNSADFQTSPLTLQA